MNVIDTTDTDEVNKVNKVNKVNGVDKIDKLSESTEKRRRYVKHQSTPGSISGSNPRPKSKSTSTSTSKRTQQLPSVPKSAYKFRKRTPLASKDSFIPRQFTPMLDNYLRIMSTAAKGTTVLIDSIMCVDAGNLPVALAKDVELLMITHGHADHIQDVCNAYSDRDNKILVVFCPAIMASDLFNMIRNTYQANKGRKYPVNEILAHLKIYAVLHPNDTDFENQTHVNMIDVDTNSDKPILTSLPIAELVKVGDLVEVTLGGRSKCAVRAFHCHHTVDTIGFCIYDSTRRLNKSIKIPAGTVVEITPPKMSADEKKEYKNAKSAAIAKARESGTHVPDINLLLGRVTFDTVDAFCKDLEIPDDVIKKSIVSRKMENGFVLESIRRIEFDADVDFDCFSENGECQLPRSAFMFFKDYEINMDGKTVLDIYHQALTPKVMVFGDTAATVFSQKLVRDMIADFPVIVIESTFLDGEDILSKVGVPKDDDPDLEEDHCDSKAHDESKTRTKTRTKAEKNIKRNLYLRLKEKKHIFLPELFHLFAKYPQKTFVLMHFSDRYDRESVLEKSDTVRQSYPNVQFAV